MAYEQSEKILVVEDDSAVRKSMAAFLEDRGFEILQAENGRVGLELIDGERPDLVLVDLRMPEVDGLEVLAAATKNVPDMPIIVVSGTGVIADAVEALHLGAWDYILKPIQDLQIVLHAVEKSLERARLRRKDREYKQELETEVEQRTADLEKANRSLVREIAERKKAQLEREKLIVNLEAQNIELEQFAYTVSHDLKTPLVTIKWLLGAMGEDLAAQKVQSVLEGVGRIGDAADAMLRLLSELLELSRVGRVANPPQDVPMADLLADVTELLAGQMADRGVKCEVAEELPVLFGDRSRLHEVMQNLLENAINYMGSQPHPKILVGARRDGSQTVCFVRDNGIGIEPRYHEKVFGLFEKLDKHGEGTGVGLALAKRIVEVHGGRIWVESDGYGKGTTFCFTLASKEEALKNRKPADVRQEIAATKPKAR